MIVVIVDKEYYSYCNSQIGFKQGLEMLNIFKSYSAKSSLLDDFGFYENQEKTLNAKKNYKSATLRHKEDDFTVSSLSCSHTRIHHCYCNQFVERICLNCCH